LDFRKCLIDNGCDGFNYVSTLLTMSCDFLRVLCCFQEQHVATCCRCVAGGKAQRNPCKTRLVAVLPIFLTSIYQSSVLAFGVRVVRVFRGCDARVLQVLQKSQFVAPL
jgi:hypothetical protein